MHNSLRRFGRAFAEALIVYLAVGFCGAVLWEALRRPFFSEGFRDLGVVPTCVALAWCRLRGVRWEWTSLLGIGIPFFAMTAQVTLLLEGASSNQGLFDGFWRSVMLDQAGQVIPGALAATLWTVMRSKKGPVSEAASEMQ
jgi:hypothetical protein